MNYTTIYFDYGIYQINKDNLKKMMINSGLLFIDNKIKNCNWNELLEIFKFFKTEDKIIKDKNMLNRNGLTGVWGNNTEAIKIVIFNDFGGKNELLPVLMIYKRNDLNDSLSSFYKNFIKKCISLGCEIGKLEEIDGKLELVFKKKINVVLINIFNNKEKNKEIEEEMFMDKINMYSQRYSTSFVEKWNECIKKYSKYTLNDFIEELKRKNELKKNDSNVKHDSNININIPETKKVVNSKSEIILPSSTFFKTDSVKLSSLDSSRNRKRIVFKINKTKN